MNYEQRAREWLLADGLGVPWGAGFERRLRCLTALCESIAAEARAEERERCLTIIEGRTDDGVPSWRAAIRAIRAGDTNPDVRLVAREDLATVIEAADRQATWTAHEYGTTAPKVVALRAAIDRLRVVGSDVTIPWSECSECHTDKPGTQRGCVTCAIFAAGAASATSNVAALVDAARGALETLEAWERIGDSGNVASPLGAEEVVDALRAALGRMP